MTKADLCVIHLFPYSPVVSGGHSNAIRGFIACQRASQINAVGIAPKPDTAGAPPSWEFPFVEVGSLWDLRWATIAARFSITAVNSLVQFYSVNLRFASLLADLRRAGGAYVVNSQGQLEFHGLVHGLKKFAYLNLVNRGPHRAAGLHLLTALADRQSRLLLPGYRGARLIQGNLPQLPNPAELGVGSRSDYGIPVDAFLLVFLGRLDVWVKGLDVLVEAFAHLPSEHFHLVLAGPDWEGGKAKLESLARQFRCEQRLHLPGPVYGAKKWALLRMADAFVSPSRWDAFSVAQAEALALGLPLVTSNQVRVAAELQEADAALTVPISAELLGKAIAMLAANPERRRALGIRAKAWVEKNLSPERAGPRFQQFYLAILQNRRSA